jgi:hypothetical protein
MDIPYNGQKKEDKRKTMVYKILHMKQKTKHFKITNHTKNWKWTDVLLKG